MKNGTNMNTLNITYDQIRDLHNGKCDLYQLQNFVEENFKTGSPIHTLILRAMKQMAPVINNLMDQRDKLDNLIIEECSDVREKLQLKSVWSNYERAEFPQSWAGKTMTYKGLGVDIPADTKIDRNVLYVVADKLITDSGDNHHIFIENFIENKGKIELVTGS
jgi:hypothetical protein